MVEVGRDFCRSSALSPLLRWHQLPERRVVLPKCLEEWLLLWAVISEEADGYSLIIKGQWRTEFPSWESGNNYASFAKLCFSFPSEKLSTLIQTQCDTLIVPCQEERWCLSLDWDHPTSKKAGAHRPCWVQDSFQASRLPFSNFGP